MQFDIRRFDIYRKIPKDLTQPTLTGACISITSVLFISYLFLSELYGYIIPDVISDLYVDDPVQHAEKLPVFLNVSLPQIQCQFIGLDIQDDMGRHEVGFKDATEKIPINENLGCRFESHFMINKVPGNFHVSTHSSRQQPAKPDMGHTIHEVRFGMQLKHEFLKGSFNPLDGMEKFAQNAQATHDYILKVVPTVYEDVGGNIHYPYQYTYQYREVLQHGHGGKMMPAVWFRYDLSPMTVKYHEKRKPFYSFLTSVCAIIGGTFTVAGILDSFIFTAHEMIKKAEIGKLS